MRTQVSQTCSKCFVALRQLRSICRAVSNDVMQLLIVALVFSRLDYGSATLGQASVCAERRCMADLQSLSSGPHSAVTAQPVDKVSYADYGCQNAFRSSWQC